VYRGEIWWANLPDPMGSEPGYRRPVLIIQDDTFTQSRIRTVIVVIDTIVSDQHEVTVAVPSQFVDFVTTAKKLAPKQLNQYYSKEQYSLELYWDD
jgi:mRNA-degrading endonuclease toxin of MazEF toxin-antitoxin module